MKLIYENNGFIFDPERKGRYFIQEIGEKKLQAHEGKMILKKEKVHPIYEIIFEDERKIISEQLIKEVEILNFRDLGGYVNQEGKQVKYGCFYRSSPILFKNDTGRKSFQALKIHTILDLRSEEEVKAESDEVLSGIQYLHQSAIQDDEFDSCFDMKELFQNEKANVLSDYMKRIYQMLPFHNKAYRVMFDLMLSHKGPFVFHCSAGKDRTGFGAYLILKTLGVDEKIIMQDYLMSNVYLSESTQRLLKHFGYVKGADELFGVKRENLLCSIAAIMNRYGSFETYVREEYDLDEAKIASLRKMYLYES